MQIELYALDFSLKYGMNEVNIEILNQFNRLTFAKIHSIIWQSIK